MAGQPTEKPEVLRLVAAIAESREILGGHATKLRDRLDVPARLRGSLKLHPSSWFFGSMASGLAAGLMFRRRSAPPAHHRSSKFSKLLLGLTLTAAKPMVKVWLANQARHWLTATLTNRFAHPSSTHPTPSELRHVHPQGPRSR